MVTGVGGGGWVEGWRGGAWLGHQTWVLLLGRSGNPSAAPGRQPEGADPVKSTKARGLGSHNSTIALCQAHMRLSVQASDSACLGFLLFSGSFHLLNGREEAASHN